MAQGLDELIEFLVGEVAFYGEGCAISDVFASVRKFGKDAEVANDAKLETGPSNVEAIQAAAKAPLTDADLRLGRLLWSHILDTGEISVGKKGKWNHLTFDELISLPEEKSGGSGAAIKDIKVRLKEKPSEQSKRSEETDADNHEEVNSLPSVRPRLFVSEDTVWKTLTGHGEDFVRLPLMEWKLILCIGATKEFGISQPDAVKYTGQDKRSVPRRTDFLAMKGYIVKRTHMVRGMKTSKLWLTRFAPKLPNPANALKGLDVSKAILVKDMEPVPWVHQWVGNKNAKGREELSYHALIQTIISVVKAWGTLRVRDLKSKLGIIGLTWQMKIVAKFLRRAYDNGNLAFTAAQFADNSFIFKDCVKFVREPTDDDWRILLATGVRSRPGYTQESIKEKRRLQRLRKKGKIRGRATSKPKPKEIRVKARVLKKRFRLPPHPVAAQWEPEKPLANTLAEYVLTGGKVGYTTAELSTATVGTEFLRYTHKLMSNMCQSDVQPAGVAEYQMTSEPIKSGITQAYAFSCTGPPPAEKGQTLEMEMALDPALAQQSSVAERDINDFGFAQVDPDAFVKDDSIDMASLVKLAPRKAIRPKSKREQNLRQLPVAGSAEFSESDESEASAESLPSAQPDSPPTRGRLKRIIEKPDTTPKRPGRPKKIVGKSDTTPRRPRGRPKKIVEEPVVAPARGIRKRKAARGVSYVDKTLEALIEEAAAESDEEAKRTRSAAAISASQELLEATKEPAAERPKSLTPSISDESEKTPDRSLPGVYLGKPGSLKPDIKKKGRPRKSIVLIFRSDKLKNPNFLPGWSDYPPPRDVAEAPRQQSLPASDQANSPALVQHEEQPPTIEPGQSVHVSNAVCQAKEPKDDSPILFHSSKAKQMAVAEPLFDVVGSGFLSAAGSSSTTFGTGAPASDTSPKMKRIEKKDIKPDARGKFTCDKCGGLWANDNGLLYHLTKGKNLCNPFYANKPAEARKKKSGGQVLDDSSESAEPSSPEHSAVDDSTEGSLASENSFDLESRPRAPGKKRGPPKKERKKKKKTSPAADASTTALPRPVLKPRSMPKNGRLGGSGIVPRGVKASEAAANRSAAVYAKLSQNTAVSGSVADENAIRSQNGAAPAQEYWEPEEELPYLKNVQTKAARPSQRRTSEAASQLSSNQEYQVFEVQHAGAAFSDEASPPHFPGPPHASGVSNPYPEELLDPSLRAMTTNADVASAAPANSPARIRKSLPARRPASSAKIAYTAIAETHQQGGNVQRLPVSIRMPNSEWFDKKGEYYATATEKQLLPLRIQEIVLYLITANGGAYPKDRKTLHWSVLKVFKATFHSSLLPTHTGTARAVNQLEKDKVIKTASVAIQPGGSWKQYDIVYLPEIRIKEDPVVSYLKSRAEALDPDMYFPEPFGPTEEEKIYFSTLDRPAKERGLGPGRRDHKLNTEIATLDAPFYKKEGLAGVRPRMQRQEYISEDETRPKKKRKYTRRDPEELAVKRKRFEADDGERPAKRTRGRKRRFVEQEFVVIEPSKLDVDRGRSANPGISSLPTSFFSHTISTAIDFLSPNTQLEEGYVPSTPSEASLDDEEVADIAELQALPGTFAETIELRERSRGVWPNLTNHYFEKNLGSFTINGWLPTQTERLIANLPKTSAEMALKITSHCKTGQWRDQAYGVFMTSVDGCKSWELSDKGKHFMSGTVAPEYVFMNFSSTKEVSNMLPVKLEWLEQNEWTLQTIPYEQLEDNDEDPYLQYDISSLQEPRRAVGRPRKHKPVKKRQYNRRPARGVDVNEIKMQRELTPYPMTKEDYFREKGEDSEGIDWKAEDTRIAAYVAVSTLTGGINKAMDWGLLMRLFPEAKLSNLRKFYAMIRRERENFIHNLSEMFQDEFLGAYESGQLGSFDFDNPLNYNWPKLVRWTLALVVREGIDLPPTRARFDRELELLPVDPNDNDWRESYHHWQRSVFNKFQDSTSEPASTTLRTARKTITNKPVWTALDAKRTALDNDKIIARSWIRALCVTAPSEYAPVDIRDKFRTLVSKNYQDEAQVGALLEGTILEMEHRRIAIKSKSSALTYGRPYRLNEHFQGILDRYANELKFSVAADFKLNMDRAFRKGEPVEIPWRTEDGMIVAAFNMQASGRIRIEPTPETKLHIPFGFKPGFYESRKFPKSHYRFGLQVVPTDRYMYNEDIDVLHHATQLNNIPAATPDGKLPMWCDFFGTPHRGRWYKMLAAVLFAYATRGAMTDEIMTQALKPCFETFEIEVAREWGLANGVLAEVTGPSSAVTCSEWWWLVLGVPMLEMASEAPARVVESGPVIQEGVATAADVVEDEVKSGAPAKNGGRRTKDQYKEVLNGKGRWRGKYRVL